MCLPVCTLIHTLLFIFPLSVLHPVHLAISHVDYNPQSGSLEIIHKIFIDDFELALQLYDQKDFKLGMENELANADMYIQKYIEKQFNIKVDGKVKTPAFVGRETDLEAIWIYQELKIADNFEQFQFHNEIMLDLFEDQKNILHVKYKGIKRSFLFRKDLVVESMSLD